VDAAYLALELVEGLVDGHHLVHGTLFGAENLATGADGDLCGRRVGTDSVMKRAQLELGIDDAIEHAVEPRRAPVDELTKAIVDPDAVAADLHLHRRAPS
jgi:hypothetical protein